MLGSLRSQVLELLHRLRGIQRKVPGIDAARGLGKVPRLPSLEVQQASRSPSLTTTTLASKGKVRRTIA